MCNLEPGRVRSHEDTNHTQRKRVCVCHSRISELVYSRKLWFLISLMSNKILYGMVSQLSGGI